MKITYGVSWNDSGGSPGRYEGAGIIDPSTAGNSWSGNSWSGNSWSAGGWD